MDLVPFVVKWKGVVIMILENKLGITNQIELSKAEEKISKKKAKQLFDTGDIHNATIRTFAYNLQI